MCIRDRSLSTFSGHMKRISGILDLAGHATLTLLDELGAGTDPAEGAALAVSILERLRRQGSLLMATTHYAELKVYALETHGVVKDVYKRQVHAGGAAQQVGGTAG